MSKKAPRFGRQAFIVLMACCAAAFAFVGAWVLDAADKTSHMYVRWTCPCLFVEGRSLDYCLDNAPDRGVGAHTAYRIDIEEESQRVSFSLGPLAKASAQRIPGQLCVVDR